MRPGGVRGRGWDRLERYAALEGDRTWANGGRSCRRRAEPGRRWSCSCLRALMVDAHRDGRPPVCPGTGAVPRCGPRGGWPRQERLCVRTGPDNRLRRQRFLRRRAQPQGSVCKLVARLASGCGALGYANHRVNKKRGSAYGHVAVGMVTGATGSTNRLILGRLTRGSTGRSMVGGLGFLRDPLPGP